MLEARTGRPVNEQPAGLFTQYTDRFIVDDDDMDSNTVTESDLSLKSRSFLHRVNDWVRKILDQSSKDAMQDSNKHSLILSKVCSQIVLKCLYLARIGRLDILWSVNKLADPSQSGPKPVINAWIDWLHIFIIRVNTNSIVMWVILPSNADWDCFKTPILQEILRIQNPLLEEHYAFLEVIHSFR